jgi:hypothetical protein
MTEIPAKDKETFDFSSKNDDDDNDNYYCISDNNGNNNSNYNPNGFSFDFGGERDVECIKKPVVNKEKINESILKQFTWTRFYNAVEFNGNKLLLPYVFRFMEFTIMNMVYCKGVNYHLINGKLEYSYGDPIRRDVFWNVIWTAVDYPNGPIAEYYLAVFCKKNK